MNNNDDNIFNLITNTILNKDRNKLHIDLDTDCSGILEFIIMTIFIIVFFGIPILTLILHLNGFFNV